MIVDNQMCVQVQEKRYHQRNTTTKPDGRSRGSTCRGCASGPSPAASLTDPAKVKQVRNRNSTRTSEPRSSRQHAYQPRHRNRARWLSDPEGELTLSRLAPPPSPRPYLPWPRSRARKALRTPSAPTHNRTSWSSAHQTKTMRQGGYNQGNLFTANPKKSAHITRHLTTP